MFRVRDRSVLQRSLRNVYDLKIYISRHPKSETEKVRLETQNIPKTGVIVLPTQKMSTIIQGKSLKVTNMCIV